MPAAQKPPVFFCQSPIVEKPGEVQALLNHIWTLEELQLFHHTTAPCWLARAYHGPASPVCDAAEHLFANRAAVRRFGRLRTLDEVRQVVASWPPERQERRKRDVESSLKAVLEDHMLVRGWCEARQTLAAVFTDVKDEGMICIVCKPMRMMLDGQEVPIIYAEMEESVSIDSARMAVMQQLSPVPQCLFAHEGHLLLANHAATQEYGQSASLTFKDILSKGEFPGGDAEMLREHDAAMTTIFHDEQPKYDCSISCMSNTGRRMYTTFKMWRMLDPVSGDPAVHVATIDITERREMELQLEEHRRLLKTQNEQLEVHNRRLTKEQAELLVENERLAERLESAVISSTQAPPALPPIDTNSAADKTLTLLYSLLNGAIPENDEVQELIDMISQVADLRQPLQLEKQLLEQKSWGIEVGQSMLSILAPGKSRSKSATFQREDLKDVRRACLDLIAEREPQSPTSSCASPTRQSLDEQQVLLGSKQLLPAGSGPCTPTRHCIRRRSWDEHVLLGLESSRDPLQTTDAPEMPSRRSWDEHRLLEGGRRASGHMDICAGLTTQTERVLQEAENSWIFDVFALDEASPKESLSILTFWLLKRCGVIKTLKINQRRLAGFLRRVEAGYCANNPYHNRLHAAAVVQTMHMILHHGGLRKLGVANDLEMLACYISAAVHDHEHPGLTNDFLINTEDAIATNYNDQSPLENHHVASAFRLMQLPHLNFHGDLPVEDRLRLRSNMIEQVLATNMASHFSVISRFQGIYQRRQAGKIDELGDKGLQSLYQLTTDEKALIRQAALKVADISHLALPTPVHLAWVGRLEAELFLQGDQERRRGLPISPLMDRNAMGITRSQVGFFDVVALPLFRSFVDVFPCSTPLLLGANTNHAYWNGQQSA